MTTLSFNRTNDLFNRAKDALTSREKAAKIGIAVTAGIASAAGTMYSPWLGALSAYGAGSLLMVDCIHVLRGELREPLSRSIFKAVAGTTLMASSITAATYLKFGS